MLTHAQIWSAIDALAERRGLTPSSLARLAGLDPTTFNRSKRIGPEGNPRWPSTESIAKILAATHVEIDDFLALMRKDEPAEPRLIPFRLLEEHGNDGLEAGAAAQRQFWDRIPAPGSESADLFALGITGEAFAPTYRDGDVIVVSENADCRRGDRVLVIDTAGKVLIARFEQGTAKQLRLKSLDGGKAATLPLASIRLFVRILWVSQ